jgi:eukaryotic-like serine/threonine-protein kinase
MAQGGSPPSGRRGWTDSGPRAVSSHEEISAAPTSRRSRSGEFAEGDLIGQKYRLLVRLGEGGMASVWRARNEALEMEVAIKFIRADLDDPRLAERLLQEARAAARLGHPAIVRVLDFGTTRAGEPYIVMEYLQGESVSEMLERCGRSSATSAVRTMLPIAHALATAHGKGIVHRDIKPDNIFLSRQDAFVQPKLFDFGVAKLELGARVGRLTEHGLVFGTPEYMAPEQARGEEADQRADIWAFTVVLYEMLTGRLPFEGKSYNAILRAIIEDTPPPTTTFAGGDAALWEILERGLSKDVEKRWQTMREIGTALASWLIQRGLDQDVSGASLHAVWIQGSAGSMPPPPRSIPPSMRKSQPSIPAFETVRVELPASAPAPPKKRGLAIVLFALFVLAAVAAGVLLGRPLLQQAAAPASEAAAAPPAAAAAPAAETAEAKKSEPSAAPGPPPEPEGEPVAPPSAEAEPNARPARPKPANLKKAPPKSELKTTL